MKTSASSFAMRSSSALIRYLVIQPRISFDCFTQFCFGTLGVGDRLFLLGDHALRIVMCLDPLRRVPRVPLRLMSFFISLYVFF